MQTVFPHGLDGAETGDRGEGPEKTTGSWAEWRRSGEVLLAQGKYEDAILALKRAIELNPRDAAVHHRLALAFAGCGKQQEAIGACMRALAVKQDYPEVLNDLGSILASRGQTAESATCFERALQIDPNFTTAVNNLGIMRFRLGNLNEAAVLFRRVLSLQPDRVETLFDLGKVLWLQGSLEDSVACFRMVVRLRPKSAEAHYHLGIALAGMGKPSEAMQAYKRALSIKPDYPEALNNLGSILKERGKLKEALVRFKRAHSIEPKNTVIINNLALVHDALNHPDEAAALWRKALALQPDYPEALNNLGLVLYRQDAFEESIACCRRAIKLRPDYLEALMTLGSACVKFGKHEEAVEAYRQVLSIRPDYPEALSNLGAVLRLRDELDESLACFKKALALRPDCPDTLLNYGNTLADSGMLPEAILALDRAMGLAGDRPGIHYNLGILLLSAGQFERGWREYEWRWQNGEIAYTGPSSPGPPWRGEPVGDRVLLLWAEQGFGDAIQFCRFAPLAAERGLRVVLMVHPPLVRLMGSLPGVETIVGFGQALPAYDFQCPLLSLPLAFDTRTESVPASVPYLTPDSNAVRAWRERFPDIPSGRLKVGLVWAGSQQGHVPIRAAVVRRRSIPPELLAPLLEVPGVQFFSLQKDGPPAPDEFGLVNLMDECRDFADTAALVANLDLIVSVDTAVVHLAGAMGKPVWVLNRFDSCWRWLQDREDSPWYPTLRLFRQARSDGWANVVARVRNELERCVSQIGESVVKDLDAFLATSRKLH